jgi:hypothetical protein
MLGVYLLSILIPYLSVGYMKKQKKLYVVLCFVNCEK